MKKLYCILALLLCCLLAGCGGDKPGALPEGVVEYLDIQSDSREAFHMDGVLGKMVGMQFHQGEPAMLWASREGGTADISLYKGDGSRETLLAGMPEDYYFAHWFMDAEGGFYRWGGMPCTLVRMDPQGKELYSVPLESMGITSIKDLCQLADGRIVFTYLAGAGASSYILSELEPDTGKVSKVGTARLEGFGRVAAGAEGLLYLDAGGVSEISLENGGKELALSFASTSYRLREDLQWDSIQTFRVLDDGGVELLRYQRSQENWEEAYVSETLRAAAETTRKTVLSIRCRGVTKSTGGVNAWLKAQVERFNQQSGTCLVVLDECPEGITPEDFARQTSVEMAAGKGPDLLYGDVLGDYAYGAIQKGALADLAPYMEASGVREEDYFPAAFGCWRVGDGIYGVRLNLSIQGWRFREGVLEGGAPDGEALADALLAWPDRAVLSVMYDSGKALRYLLQGSETLWGVLDWDAGTCDFSGAAFAKMLEAAKRLGNDGRAEKPELMEPRSSDIAMFDTSGDQKAEEMEAAGVLFDDGFHPVITGTSRWTVAVNANSAHLEEAWEFVSLLLGEEAQMAFQGGSNSGSIGVPVHRGAFEVCLEKTISFYSQSILKTRYGYNVTDVTGNRTEKYPRNSQDIPEEKIVEYREFIEDARFLPIRTEPLLDIIMEEAAYYFNDVKSIEEVTAIIQNRVQLYMDENM